MPYTNKYNPAEDGITHLNIYSKSAVELGKFLSNFARTPIKTPEGDFASIEGYWHWLGTNDGKQKDTLRHMYGYKAKQQGVNLKNLYGKKFDKNFENKIKAALKYKFNANTDLLLRNFDLIKLPLTHYYTFVSNGKTVVYDAEPDFQWIIDYIREYLDEFLKSHNNNI